MGSMVLGRAWDGLDEGFRLPGPGRFDRCANMRHSLSRERVRASISRASEQSEMSLSIASICSRVRVSISLGFGCCSVTGLAGNALSSSCTLERSLCSSIALDRLTSTDRFAPFLLCSTVSVGIRCLCACMRERSSGECVYVETPPCCIKSNSGVEWVNCGLRAFPLSPTRHTS